MGTLEDEEVALEATKFIEEALLLELEAATEKLESEDPLPDVAEETTMREEAFIEKVVASLTEDEEKLGLAQADRSGGRLKKRNNLLFFIFFLLLFLGEISAYRDQNGPIGGE